MRIIFLLVVLFVSQLCIGQDNPIINKLDGYFEQGRKDWSLPGMSISIVKDGKILMSKGYGETKLGSRDMVDGQTLFMIGSTTKAIVAASMAMLVDEGKVKWSDKVIDHLSDFRLYDPYVTREMTIQDLFTHNSGVGNADLLWALWGYTTEEVVHRMRYLEPSYSFRGGYTYQNIMYATAGLVIEKLSGMHWDEFVTTRIFQPLGMTRTVAMKSQAEKMTNRSRPHYKTRNGVIEIIDSNADSIGAAGSIWSCSDDMTRWMNFVLDSARVNGQRLISAENYAVLHQPKIVIPRRQFYPTASLTNPHFTTYSLGWFQHDYRGHYVQFHTGSLNGSIAIIGLVPDLNIGVYFLGNLDHAEFRHAVMYRTIDALLGLPERDWSKEFLELYSRGDQAAEDRLKARNEARLEGTNLSLPLENYTGTYTNQYLGDIRIYVAGEGLEAEFRPDRHISLTHWHRDSFLAVLKEYASFDDGDIMDFVVDNRGRVSFEFAGQKFVRSN